MADFREALRQLRKAPGITTTAVITLALGIGATTAIFTLVHQVMLKSLPVTNPEELWRIGDKIRCCNWGGYTQGDDGDFALFSWEAYNYFRAHTPEFTDLAALEAGNTQLALRRAGSQAPAETRNGEYVSGNFFRTFGVQAWIGRLMTDADDHEGAAAVAVMSYRIWRDKYGSDPSVVGASYQINGQPFTVIGVGPPGFYGAKLAGWGMPDLWLPLTTEPLLAGATPRIHRPNGNFIDLIGRVRPGVNAKTLEAKLKVELQEWLASHVPDMDPGEKQLWRQQTLHLTPGGAGVAAMRDDYEDGLKLLLIAAACVLMVACANLANLMLARGWQERSLTCLRVALGASRGRLVRKVLLESVLLAVTGAVFGIGAAYAGTRLILYLAFQTGGPNNYVPINASPSWPMLLFALGVAVLTGVAFGIAPAWMAARADPAEALRGANRSVGAGRHAWAQKALVVVQIAVSLVLLCAAALLSQSLRNLERQNFGFETKDRYIAWINPALANYKPEQLEPRFREITDRLKQIPGVRMAAPALYAPMTGDSWNDGIRIEGRPEPAPKEDTGAGWSRVMPGFFQTIAAKIMLGRPITDADTAATRKVAVVNQAFARRFFSGQNPIGQHFGVGRIKYSATYEIVGVTNDIRYMTWGYKQPVRPMFWVPEAQTVDYDDPAFRGGEIGSHYLNNIVIWAPRTTHMEEQVRKALASIDPNLVLYGVDEYSKVVSADFQRENMIATLTTVFGALGLALACVGLYGVLAYTVARRTGEIGLRMALGADRGRVIGMVLGSASRQVGIGLALGIPAALASGRLMANQLFGLKASDPAMLITAMVVIGVAGLVASFIPAWRAAAVDPMVALRTE